MNTPTSQTLHRKKRFSSKLIAGFAALATTAIIAAGSFAAAAPSDKPTKAECEAAGFSNYGQCVKEWAQNKNRPGGGYGGGGGNEVNVRTDIDVGVEGDNNVVDVVTNIVVRILN
jgi:hypothetical protein